MERRTGRGSFFEEGAIVDAKVRPAKAEDAEAVRECVIAAYSKYVERIGCRRVFMRKKIIGGAA